MINFLIFKNVFCIIQYLLFSKSVFIFNFHQVEAVVDKAYKNFSDKLNDALKVLSAMTILAQFDNYGVTRNHMLLLVAFNSTLTLKFKTQHFIFSSTSTQNVQLANISQGFIKIAACYYDQNADLSSEQWQAKIVILKCQMDCLGLPCTLRVQSVAVPKKLQLVIKNHCG